MQPKKNKKIYLIYSPELGESGLHKIGIAKQPEKRLKQLQTGCPYKLEIIYIVESKFTSKVEKFLHKKFSHKKNVQKFDQNLKGEWFNLDVSDILEFKKTCSEIERKLEFLEKERNPFV